MSKRHLVEAAVFVLMLIIFFVFLFFYLAHEPTPTSSEPAASLIPARFQSREAGA